MSHEHPLLEKLEQGVVEHGGDLGGWTKLDSESLKLFDGRVAIGARGGRPRFAVAGYRTCPRADHAARL